MVSLHYSSVVAALDISLHAKIVVQLVHVGVKLRVGNHFDDASMFHHVVPVRDRRRETEVLLDQKYGETLALEPRDRTPDLLDDDRREPLGRLVEQQQMRASAQDAADREHLLLAAGKLGALAAAPLAQIRKKFVDLLDREAAFANLGRQQQVF